MTSIFNFSSTSSANPANLNGDSSLLSNLKYPTTFIIQPPSSTQIQPTTLLTKRCRPAELGDLLMKKIKTQTSNFSESNSQPSPMREDAIYDSSEGLECRSTIEDPRSPSTKSYNEDSKANQQKMIEELLMPQRSLSTPLFGNFGPLKEKNTQRQLQNALETLQKKLIFEQQASLLKSILQRASLAQETLMIPPLQAKADSSISSLKNTNGLEKPVFKVSEGEPEIFVGEVEYPLLSLAPTDSLKNLSFPSMNNVTIPKRGKKALARMAIDSPDSDEPRNGESLFESLAATRAETQRSDSDSGEEFGKVDGRKRRGKKAAAEKVKKTQKKEKDQEKSKVTKKQQKKEELLSPRPGKKLTERRKNKWQKETDHQLKVSQNGEELM